MQNNNSLYIVRLKDGFCMPLTSIRTEFCGYLVNQTPTTFYFELNGSRNLVLIPHSKIEWMAPALKVGKKQENENAE